MLQADTDKILWGSFLSFSVVSPYHNRSRTRLVSPQTEYIQVDSRLALRLRKSPNREHA